MPEAPSAEGGGRDDEGPIVPDPLRARSPLRTPRAAALAGIIFSETRCSGRCSGNRSGRRQIRHAFFRGVRSTVPVQPGDHVTGAGWRCSSSHRLWLA